MIVSLYHFSYLDPTLFNTLRGGSMLNNYSLQVDYIKYLYAYATYGAKPPSRVEAVNPRSS